MDSKSQYLNWRFLKIRKRIVRAACSRLYRDSNGIIGNSIMVAGTGRSGTTWLASVIASQLPCRIMFEPFHSQYVGAFRKFSYFQYMRPREQNSELWSYAHRVFSGKVRHRWIDRQVETIFPRYRLIKEIRANLFLKWIENMFPGVPLLLIVRHPVAVVLSRMQLNWATDADIQPFLSQPELVDDFLVDKLDVIKRARTIEEKHAVIWAISYLVPIRQFGMSGLNVVFYENLVTQPEVEIPRIFETLKLRYRDSVFDELDRPSTTTSRKSAVLTGEDKVGRWKSKLSPAQIGNILSVVRNFGLDYIYGDSAVPLVEDL